MSRRPRFRDAIASVATAILIASLTSCEQQPAPGEPGFVDPAPIGNDVDDPATLNNIPIETAIEVLSGHTFRVLVDGVEVSPSMLPAAGITPESQYVHPEFLTQDRIAVEVLTVDGWQPTTLDVAYQYASGSAYTNPDGSYRPYYGMKVLGDGRIVRNTEDYETVDEIPRDEIEKLRCGWTASATHSPRSVTVFVDHRTQPESTLTFGAWSVTLPAEFTGSLSPPILETTTSVDVSLNGSYLGLISLPAYDPNTYWASSQWFIDTTSSRSYVCYLEFYTDIPQIPYGYGSNPDSQYTTLSGQAIYSLPFTIDYFLQSPPESVYVETYFGVVGTISKGVLQDAGSYAAPYVPTYSPPIPYTPGYSPIDTSNY